MNRDLLSELEALGDPRTRCFLCAQPLLIGGHTEEHVIPLWAQRRFSLLDKHLVLLNNTSIPYRQLTVPCCEECNKTHLRSVEDSLSQTVDLGRNAVTSLGIKPLFLWIGKMIYGLLYKEMMLLVDRADPSRGQIVSADFLSKLQMHRLFLQQARGVVKTVDFNIGTIRVFEAQPLPARELEWDFIDDVDSLVVSVRAGRVAIIGALADGGAQEADDDIYSEYYDVPLHPLQIRELFARITYRARCGTRVPKYLVGQYSQEVHVHQSPLGGFSMKPLFEEWDDREYAQILSAVTGAPFEEVYRDDKVMTWLNDEEGNVQKIEFRDAPHLPLP